MAVYRGRSTWSLDDMTRSDIRTLTFVAVAGLIVLLVYVTRTWLSDFMLYRLIGAALAIVGAVGVGGWYRGRTPAAVGDTGDRVSRRRLTRSIVQLVAGVTLITFAGPLSEVR